MAFLRGTGSHSHLLQFAGWLGHEKGITTIMTLLTGDTHDRIKNGSAVEAQKKLDVFLEGSNLTAFGKVVAVEDFYKDARVVAQAHGIAALRANVALFGWSVDQIKAVEFASLVRDFVYLDTSVLLLNYDEQRGFGRRKRIDVWWGGLENNGNLMILIAHLISQTDAWRGSKVRLLQVVADEKDVRTTENELNDMLSDARISADVKIHPPLSEDKTIQQLIHEESGESDLVVLGLRFPEEGQESTFMTRMTSFMEHLPTTVLVKSVNIEDIFS
jgi:hypothetical protein